MGLFSEMKQMGLWRGYERHVLRLNPVLERMAERGMPVDPEAFAAVVKQLEAAFVEAKQKMNEIVPLAVKAKKQYKKQPKKKLEECITVDGVWYRVLPWTPSNKGLLSYIRHKGHKVPTNFKTKKETTNALEVIRLSRQTGDPLYRAVIEYRKAQTILSNHVKNWKPGPDNRVHTSFYFDPATGQLSSRRPNVQNAPKHDDPEFGGYAKVFRSMIRARAGHTIMEFDYKAAHVITLGFEAQDPIMLRMGRLDIHSFVTAHFLKLGDATKLMALPDDELREYLKWVKKNHKFVRDAQCKHAILGYNNGMGYKKLYAQYAEFFSGMNEAKRVMTLLDNLFPITKKYRDDVCQKAHDQGYLISRHGYIRYFWEVFRWQGGDWKHGDDHEAALCFFTQNDAHGHLKDAILEIGESGLGEKFGMLNTIHDSIIFECPNPLVIECRDKVKAIMEAPSKVLIDPVVAPNGLSIEVDVQAGPDWSAMKGI